MLELVISKRLWPHIEEAINKLESQGRKASNCSGVCLYRGPSGSKCLVGHLIKDEFYNENLEGLGLGGLEVIEALTKSLGFEPTDTEIAHLRTLQSRHDGRWDGLTPFLKGVNVSLTKDVG